MKRRTEVIAAPLLADTRPLKKARYLRRWARRLKEFAFSSEDAIILAYGSFGLDVESQAVGVDAIVTTDIRLAEHYRQRHHEIKNQFDEMILNLRESYTGVTLPRVVTTATVLSFV